MYTEFYGLRELPFSLTPDPRFLYFTPSHKEVLANLRYGITNGKPLSIPRFPRQGEKHISQKIAEGYPISLLREVGAGRRNRNGHR